MQRKESFAVIYKVGTSVESRYAEQVRQEQTRYRNITNVHELPSIYHYWSERYLLPKLNACCFASLDDFYLSYIKKCKCSPRIVSVGSGNCDLEVHLAQNLKASGIDAFHFDCVELNSDMLARGRTHALTKGLASQFDFIAADLNSWMPSSRYDVVIASHSLHHVVNLEHLFEQIQGSLAADGWFLINDMIGRNGHMRWPEAEHLIRGFWQLLPESYRYDHQLKRLHPEFVNFDCSREGFEGIRAQDILPLLINYFHFHFFLGFANLISVFIDRSYGHNFDPRKEWDRFFIDAVAQLDEFYLDEGSLKPTQMIAALSISAQKQVGCWNQRTPERSVRDPDLVFGSRRLTILDRLF